MKRPIDRISRGGSPGFTRLSYGRQRRRGLTARGALAALVLWLGPATVLSAITSTAGSAWSSMFGPGRPTATPTALSTPTPPADPTPTGGPSPTASPTIPGGLSKWPAENSAPVLYTTELSQYQGRAFDDQALKGVVVVLDPGHGSTPGGLQESGAVIGDMQESTINLQVADVLKAVLESHGATVVMTRNPLADEFRSLHYRIALTAQTVFAKQKAFWTRTGTTGDAALLDGLAALFQPSLTNNTDAYSTGRSIFKGLGASADLRTLLDLERQHGDMVFLSLHCNILPQYPSANGVQVYYASNSSVYKDQSATAADPTVKDKAPIDPAYQFYDDAARLHFANDLHDALVVATPRLKSTSGLQEVLESDYAVLRGENLVSALVEMGFLSNKSNLADLQNAAVQKQIAVGLATGIYDYFCKP